MQNVLGSPRRLSATGGRRDAPVHHRKTRRTPAKAQQLVAKIWTLLNDASLDRAKLETADDLGKRATSADPNDASAWAAWFPSRLLGDRSRIRLTRGAHGSGCSKVVKEHTLDSLTFSPQTETSLRSLLMNRPAISPALRPPPKIAPTRAWSSWLSSPACTRRCRIAALARHSEALYARHPRPRPQFPLRPRLRQFEQRPGERILLCGIAGELLTGLRKIPGLRVAAQTSAFSFKGKNDSAKEVGEKLNTAHVVEGSIQQSGKNIKITARLSRAATNEEICSESCGPLELTDVFATQSEIAHKVVAGLRGQLTGETTANATAAAAVQAGIKVQV